MPRAARLVVPGYPHHVTHRGAGQLSIFGGDRERRTYLEFMKEHCQHQGVKALAWCLMSNHVHLVLVPANERSLALAVGGAHRRYALMKNSDRTGGGEVFEGRFHSCVLDEKHLPAAVRYVEMNPVRAGMAERAEDYAWSSARFHLGMIGSDALVSDGGLMGLVKNWRDFLAEEDAEREEMVRRATVTGKPAGSREFVARVASWGHKRNRGRTDREPR